MKELDPESQAFIEFSMDYLNGPEYYEFLLECRRKFQNFISRNPDEIKSRLKEKLTIGGYEHGSPQYHLDQVEKEMEFEFLDILGWSLIGLWNEQKLQ